MAYQGLPDGPMASQAMERYRKEAETRSALIDNAARVKELEYAKIPWRSVRGPDSAIRMAGDAISQVANRVGQANQAVASAPSWTESLTTDYSQSPGFLGNSEAATTAFSIGGPATQQMGGAFENVSGAAASGLRKIVGNQDWASTVFGS